MAETCGRKTGNAAAIYRQAKCTARPRGLRRIQLCRVTTFFARGAKAQRKALYMQFKIVPAIGPRYWVGIMIASICGANMGDFIPDVLKLSDLGGLVLLALIFRHCAGESMEQTWK